MTADAAAAPPAIKVKRKKNKERIIYVRERKIPLAHNSYILIYSGKQLSTEQKKCIMEI